MAADAWSLTNNALTSLQDGTFDIDTDSFTCQLHSNASNISDSSTTLAGVTGELSTANGYTAGGDSVALTLSGTSTVTTDISVDPSWSASGGDITCRYAVIGEVSGDVLCWTTLDNTPADVTATDGNDLTVAANASGVYTLTQTT